MTFMTLLAAILTQYHITMSYMLVCYSTPASVNCAMSEEFSDITTDNRQIHVLFLFHFY